VEAGSVKAFMGETWAKFSTLDVGALVYPTELRL